MAEVNDALSVTQLNEYIKMLIDKNPTLTDVSVKGEISNFVNHRTGHYYFTLKDSGSLIRAVMFRGSAAKLSFIPEDGMLAVCRGRVSAFVRDGQYQLYAVSIEPDGVGSLYFAFEQLKKKLAAEGMFDERRKRPLPKIPTRVGVITSPTGAAIRDIINIISRRFPYAKVVLYPSLVQGSDAVPQLCAGLDYFNRNAAADVIIIGRGGGSIEDLWAFNSEELARMVAASDIPVISAVGHETDFTICDFAADRRAPTPSAAAELAVPETGDLSRRIGNLTGRMALLLKQDISRRRQRLDYLAGSRAMSRPEYLTEDKRMNLLHTAAGLDRAAAGLLQSGKYKLGEIAARLEGMSPLSILSRGYCTASGDNGRLIRSAGEVSAGERINLRVTDGTIFAEVIGND